MSEGQSVEHHRAIGVTQAESSARHSVSTERLRAAFEGMAVGMILKGAEGETLESNPALRRMLGYGEEELRGMTRSDYTHPEDAGRDAELYRQLLAGKRDSFRMEKRYVRKDGSVMWGRLSVSRIEGAEGEPAFAVGVVEDITERKRAEETLKESEERFRHLFEHSLDALLVHDEQGRMVDCNLEACRSLGYTREELLELSVEDIATDVLSEEEKKARGGDTLWARAMNPQSGTVVGFHENEHRRKDGTTFPVEVGISAIDYGGRRLIFASCRDLTERKEAEEALKESEERYRTVVEEQTELVCRFLPDLTLTFANEAYCRYFGLEPEEVIGRSFIGRVAVEDRVFYEQQLAWLDKENPRRTVEHRVLTPGGEVHWQQWTDTAIFGGERRIVEYQSVGRDVTERRALEERLEHQALHDSLTDLPNRRLFVDRLGQALRRTRRQQGRVAVLFMDLDNFKVVNDSLGHETGDRLIVKVAERLKGCLRPEDTLARFGGDEFTVLLEDVESPEDAVRVAERIVTTFQEPFLLHGRELFVAGSVGVALGGADTESPQGLLRDADTAMYRAKDEAADYRVFGPGMRERTLDRLDLETELRRAVEVGEFVIHYQPKVRLKEVDTVAEVEALLRWEHPQRGLLMPDEFVPLAEKTGLIVPIGRWVLKETCRQVKAWQERHPMTPPLVACVNVSAGQLRYPDLLNDVGSALRESGIEGRTLALEITEGALVKDTETSTILLKELRDLGIRFALDDFGSEYSSLSYLMRLPVDFVKIDKSFVWGLGEDPRAAVIVEAIISLAHSLGLEAVGEGVESAEQLESLRSMGCDLAQGYHLAKPLPPEGVPEFLAQ